MSKELKEVFPFIEKWVLSKDATYCGFEDGGQCWSTDYTEYWLIGNALDFPQFIAFNIELKRFMIFSVPVASEENFIALMGLLNQ
jgi:hypothetical protein